MTVNALAANAYQRLATIGDSAAGGVGLDLGNKSEGGTNFGELLQQAVGAVGNASRAADAQAVQAVQGQGDMVSMVTAVAESEVALQTLVSVRDRVISAYEEIMRMAI